MGLFTFHALLYLQVFCEVRFFAVTLFSELDNFIENNDDVKADEEPAVGDKADPLEESFEKLGRLVRANIVYCSVSSFHCLFFTSFCTAF